ncbi:hypothetical protein Fluta_0501 [Fluviicola taffensis DSM 16823]|uniref:Uncharacterized protein n=1 Tax=Fluviicola taffensis (strain DSM 16823 / NCIMB 13979 / RW262) TaxID=755732 RepID=F2IFP8_FLUTR|nr:hypothetical protein Fluta_0501 [Fluviicola taffensis DSM 16823]
MGTQEHKSLYYHRVDYIVYYIRGNKKSPDLKETRAFKYELF